MAKKLTDVQCAEYGHGILRVQLEEMEAEGDVYPLPRRQALARCLTLYEGFIRSLKKKAK